jgi:hypothetical protein
MTNAVIAGPADTLAAALRSAGHEGPVLIVADTGTIGRDATAWGRSFAAVGWKHRVRRSEGPADPHETDALAAEVTSLGGRTLVAAGGEATLAAARAAAARTNTPCVVLTPP